MEYEKLYKNEAKFFNDIVKRYDLLQENDIASAFALMKDALQAYNRWSKILCDVRKAAKRGELSELKERLRDMCKYLNEVHTDSRMIWSKAKEDYLKEGD